MFVFVGFMLLLPCSSFLYLLIKPEKKHWFKKVSFKNAFLVGISLQAIAMFAWDLLEVEPTISTSVLLG